MDVEIKMVTNLIMVQHVYLMQTLFRRQSSVVLAVHRKENNPVLVVHGPQSVPVQFFISKLHNKMATTYMISVYSLFRILEDISRQKRIST